MCNFIAVNLTIQNNHGISSRHVHLKSILLLKVEGSEIKAQLLLALAWFHGIVQERRIFMPQGWTKEYDFSVGDLRCGAGERYADVLTMRCRIGCLLVFYVRDHLVSTSTNSKEPQAAPKHKALQGFR